MAGTTLGTAWIQIKPSMSGMTSSIRSELSGVGEKEGQNVGTKFSTGFAAKIGVISGITQSVFAKVSNTISSQLDDAVYRADTLARFPKVMEMMGYNADEAAKAVEKLRAGVAGIPTSLADVVSGTQRLAAITGDVGKASDWILAISDAMLVTTGDVDEASRGMQQFIQVLSRGKPAGDDWNTIMEVASPIMNELAKSLGYASASLGGDFYTALQKGTLSIEDMMAALVKLDQNGAGSMDSLHDRVKAGTSGIGSSMTNLRQSISNAMVSVIQAIGPEKITAAIGGLKDALVGIVNVIGGAITFVIENWGALEPIFTGVLSFLAAVMAVFAAQKVYNGLVSIFTLLTTNPILAVIGGIIFAISELIIHFEDIKNTVEGVFGAIGATIGAFVGWVGEQFQGIWDTVTSIFQNIGTFFQNVWNTIASIFTGIGQAIGDAVSGAFKAVVNTILAFIEGFINTPINILNGFLDIINGAFGWIGVHLDHIQGVQLPRLATGGIVEGIGTDTSDSNLYALSKGEYVIKASSARQIGYDNLDRMNETGEVTGGVQNNYFTIEGYNKNPEELANIISRKIAFNQQGVLA